jgi:ornithine cyclodeaminase/alanine dehydrogenase-like protein (mu-crystallin family)
MINLSAEILGKHQKYIKIITEIKKSYKKSFKVPPRVIHEIKNKTNPGNLFIMPAWESDEYIGVKVSTSFPSNTKINMPSIHGRYILFSSKTGFVLSVIDGAELTAIRTVASAALATSILSKKSASSMLIVGTGKLASKIPFFYGSVRNIKIFYVWGRNFSKAKELCRNFKKNKINAIPIKNIKEVSKKVDIISCVTPSKKPLVFGRYVSKGCHIDLVGAFNISMRESDNKLIERGRVFFDNKEGGFKEAGDVLIPLKKKLISKSHIKGDFYDLIQEKVKGRTSNEQVTIYKSVGDALQDYSVARYFYKILK